MVLGWQHMRQPESQVRRKCCGYTPARFNGSSPLSAPLDWSQTHRDVTFFEVYIEGLLRVVPRGESCIEKEGPVARIVSLDHLHALPPVNVRYVEVLVCCLRIRSGHVAGQGYNPRECHNRLRHAPCILHVPPFLLHSFGFSQRSNVECFGGNEGVCLFLG